MPLPKPRVEVRRAADRAATRLDWLDSRHSFSFGQHYDPDNTHHGLLLVNNHDTVLPATGYDSHPHRDIEIITWVLRGALVHRDSAGQSGVIYPGLVQRMSAGTGIQHSERNDSWRADVNPAPPEPAEFVQMWVVSDGATPSPSYEQREVTDLLSAGALTPVASGRPADRGSAAITIGNKHAALHVARLEFGQRATLPEAPYLHVYVARGRAEVEGAGVLELGDALRLTAIGGQRVSALEPTELLVWEMHARWLP